MYTIEQMEKLIEESRKELNKSNEEIGYLHDIIYGYNKYHHSKIYKIVSENTEKIYIGSTTQTLNKRLMFHVNDYKCFIKGTRKYKMSSSIIIESGNYKIELLEQICVKNEKELLKIEGTYQRKYNNLVNKVVAGRTNKEYRHDKIEILREKDKNRKNKIERNKKSKEKYICGCGSTLSKSHKARHEKLDKHIQFTILNNSQT